MTHTHVLPYLIEIYNGEAIRLPCSHVSNAEKEPLCMLLRVEVKAEVEFVVPTSTAGTRISGEKVMVRMVKHPRESE